MRELNVDPGNMTEMNIRNIIEEIVICFKKYCGDFPTSVFDDSRKKKGALPCA